MSLVQCVVPLGMNTNQTYLSGINDKSCLLFSSSLTFPPFLYISVLFLSQIPSQELGGVIRISLDEISFLSTVG
jgi:hypothetical protein